LERAHGEQERAMSIKAAEPISRHMRDAFYGAVQLYPDWTPAGQGPFVSVDGYRYTISQVCNLASAFSDGLPDDLLGSLMFFLNEGDRDLLETLANERTYAGGARYLLKLMDRRGAGNQTLEESRRNA
jgi:hypothetical protein